MGCGSSEDGDHDHAADSTCVPAIMSRNYERRELLALVSRILIDLNLCIINIFLRFAFH